MDINLLDLIIGISLRIENPSKNHYYSSIDRIGRALSESKNRAEIESHLLELIKDESLDDYNRVLMYFLFDHYNHYLEDNNLQKENSVKLQAAVATLPSYISSKIVVK